VVRRYQPTGSAGDVLVVTPKGGTVRRRLIARLAGPPAAFRQMPAADQEPFARWMLQTLGGDEPQELEARRRCSQAPDCPSDKPS